MPRKVLIVDDVAVNRQILRAALSKDYDILEAENGKDALELLQRKYKMLSAVLLDIMMPEMDGYEVLRRMQDNVALSQIPVIVITGSDEGDARAKALALGANDFVTKPYNPSIIKHCLRNNIALRETASIVNAIQRDKLTGLYTREAFFERAKAMLQEREAGYYVMSCFDVNNFKLINDQYGAAEGDRVLRFIGHAVAANMEARRGIGCRISADNFAALYPAGEDGDSFITMLQNDSATPEVLQVSTAFSIGRYIVEDLSLSAAALYDRAYLAKQSVKGRYDAHVAYFDEAMRDELVLEQSIIAEMDTALAGHQFEVWFQPQYNHASGALIGAEALVRWRHPQRGLIFPGVFIPIFERNGFIYELDKYVWEETCRHLRRWLDEGREPLPISVNISRYDIFRADLIDVITGLIQTYAIPVELLRLEITESAFARSTKQIVEIVKQLIGHGFTVEIDDFGSGYSSLNTLKSVPAQILKLDMRFLEDDDDSERGGNILESIVRMAKWLGMSVIAEGVETIEQANYLKSIGCAYVQGYLYARPMPVAEYEAHCRGAGKEDQLAALETVENLDNNSFWDPKSMDTLIFNSYVGGAGIFEYCDGALEFLRANDKFVEFLGSGVLAVEDILKLDWLAYLSEDGRRTVRDVLERSIAGGEEIREEYVFTDLPGCPGKTYLRATMRVIAAAGKRYLVYCTIENISAQRLAEQRERASAEQMQAIMRNIGGGVTATIIRDGSARYLYANDKYYAQLGYTREQFEREVPNSFALVHPDDRDGIVRKATVASAQQKPYTCTYRIIRRDGAVRWMLSNISLMNFPGVDEPVQLSVANDITEQIEADLKERRASEQMQAVMDNVGMGITATIIRDGNAEFVFSNNRYYEILGYTREQYEAEVTNPFVTIHPEDRPRMIEHTAELSRSGRADVLEYRALRRDGSSTWLRTSIAIGRFDGIDEPVQLSTFRDISEEKQAQRTMQMLMDDTPGGFCRMRVYTDRPAEVVYCNEGYCRLVGMTREEVTAIFSNNPLGGVHPDDYAAVAAASMSMVDGGQFSVKCRLIHGSGGYIWVQLSGRFVKDASGETYLNSYYSDITEQVKAEDMQKELLNNLPCGAALFRFDGSRLSPVHINKRYWELVGRDTIDSNEDAVVQAIHPQDRAMMMNELTASLAEKRNAACDLRIRYRENDYRPFHAVARSIPQEDGAYYIYIAYTPVLAGEMSFRESLPFVLSAIMESSTDITFAKDKDLQYICASRGFMQMAGIESEHSIIGKTDFDIFEPAIAERFRADDQRLLNDGAPLIDVVEPLPSADGAPRFAKTSKLLLRDTGGNVIGLYGIGRDITEALETDSQLKLLTNSIPGGIAIYEGSPGALDKIRLTYFSDGLCRLFGYTREEYAARSAENPLGLVFEEDFPILMAQVKALIEDNVPIDCVYRARAKGGSYKWINIKAVAGGLHDGKMTVNAVLFDVTKQQQAVEQLRISEEMNRLAMDHTGHKICRYNVADRRLILPEINPIFSLSSTAENVPYEPVRRGEISPETADAYTAFYEDIMRGSAAGSMIFQRRSEQGWRWVEAHYTTIFSDMGEPVSAVVSYSDVTEQREKETAFKRWQQMLQDKDPKDYTLFRSNITKDTSFDTKEGDLLQVDFNREARAFNDRTREYVEQCVYEEDRDAYTAFLNSDTLLAGYYRGKRTGSLEYREKLPEGGVRWLRVTADLVEYPHSTDIEASLMYESIDESKRAELMAIERAETDPLTGVLNRMTFSSRVEQLIRSAGSGTQHALLMLDVDGFKLVNDVFGHRAGDQALLDIAATLRSVLRKGDLVGRLGGDEFLVFLRDVPNEAVAENKAKQICLLTRKSFSLEVQISGSVGIVFAPRDGTDFETLYRKVDAALYYVKGSGKNSYAVYHDSMCDQHLDPGVDVPGLPEAKQQAKKRRMLIVDDNLIDYEFLANIFKDEFIIEKAKDGNTALIRLRHYGAAISVVLLDLMMPGMDGFAVLEKMQSHADLQAIPVLVVSGDEDRETCLRVIKSGAADFVTKPVDPELLRVRVRSAVSRAENERLRAKNSFLELQNDETTRYKTALECTGIAVIEYDWLSGVFYYEPGVCRYLAGNYDGRPLWHILLTDLVADTETVQQMQSLVLQVAEDRTRMDGSLTVTLKTAEQQRHRFRMNVCKQVNEHQLADKLIITLTDLEREDQV